MKTNKKKSSTAKKLMPAFAMLAVSAMTLSSATYAWFSMNTSVQVSGMQIQAKNESGSLIIGAQTYDASTHAAETAPTLATVQGANLTSVNLGNAAYNYTDSFAVKPCAHNAQTTLNNFNSVANWSYKVADAPSSYASTGGATALTTFEDYVIYYDLYITVASGSPAMSNLKCNATIQASGAANEVRNATRVLVASDSNAEEFYNAHTESGSQVVAHTEGTNVLATSISSDSLVHVRVYLYIDGEDSTVYTNNITNLTSANVQLSFTAENATA